MNRRTLIGAVIVLAAFCVALIVSRLPVDRDNAGKDEARHNSGAPVTDVRTIPYETHTKRSLRSSRGVELGGEDLKSHISAILDSRLTRDEKMDQVRGLLAKLSSVDGCEKTVTWLKGKVGEGTDFTVLVSSVFTGSNESMEILFKEAGKLPTVAGNIANTVLFQKILESDDPELLVQSWSSPGDANRPDEGMALALKLILLQSDSLQDSMISMRSIMGKLEGESLVQFRNAYLIGLSKASPKDAWKEMQRLEKSSSDTETLQSVMRSRISVQLRMLGAKESLEFLVQEGGSASEIEKSVTMWGNMNPVDLNKWITNQMGSLSPSQQDGMRSGLACLLLEKREFSAVKEQMDGIVDSDVREDIEARLVERQRETIREDVSRDPNGTLTALVSGSSQYGDYLIEEAMSNWVTKDFDEAQDWYQQNWKSLPANKSQYIAAAFANQATKQGDTETARQWAAYIQDAKTKQRIEAGIARAESSATK